MCLAPDTRDPTWGASLTPHPEWAGEPPKLTCTRQAAHADVAECRLDKYAWRQTQLECGCGLLPSGLENGGLAHCHLLPKGPLADGGRPHHLPETLNLFLSLPSSFSSLSHAGTIIEQIFAILSGAFEALGEFADILHCFRGKDYGQHRTKLCKDSFYYFRKMKIETNTLRVCMFLLKCLLTQAISNLNICHGAIQFREKWKLKSVRLM